MNHLLRLRHFNRSYLVGSVATAAMFFCFDNNTDFSASVPLQDSPPLAIANAAAKVAPSVVNISVPRVFFVIPIGRSHGSGTIINNDGTILTSAHVVLSSRWTRPSSKGKVAVTLHDGRTFEGRVVNANRPSDIAVVKIDSETPLPKAKLGSSSRLRPGDWGNSGGPLVNVDGEVVGVNFYKGAEGLSFSVPIDLVCKLMEHFKKTGRVLWAFNGLKMLDLNEMIIAEFKKRHTSFPNVNKGILVQTVIPGSLGDRVGLRPGDVVIEFDGKPGVSIEEDQTGIC